MGGKEKERTNDAPEPDRKGSLVKVVFVIALVALAGLGLLTYISFEPQELTDIEGYQAVPSKLPVRGRDLGAELERASRDGTALRITEEELNAYLRRTVKFEQGGAFKGWVSPRGVWVRLSEGEAEVIIERELGGERRHTISMFLRPEQEVEPDGLATTVHRGSGRWGRVRVARGFMYLTKSSFASLAGVYAEELKILKNMFTNKVRIEITDDYIDLSAPDPGSAG